MSAGGGGAAAGGSSTSGGAAAGASGGAASGGAAAGASVSARLLVVMMAGKSTDSVTSSSSALKQSGIKILCLGMGGSFDKEQMTAMASSSEYFVSVASFAELSGFSQQFITLISKGKNQLY